MPNNPTKDAKEKVAKERARLLGVVTAIYADGFADGMSQVAYTYQLSDAVPPAGTAMARTLKPRLGLVEDAVESYVEMVRNKGADLVARGIEGPRLEAELTAYARNLADRRGEIIAEMEHAQAKLDGAGRVLDEAGVPYEWRFPHFDLGPKHVECLICKAIREGAPYTQEEAEENGFPSHPHPGCDHGWVIVPVGEDTLTEQFPPASWWARSGGSGPPRVTVRAGGRR